ncbi:hypothetical protein J6S88_01920 [bacterium]|nr:hypothetical protein [bacterium]
MLIKGGINYIDNGMSASLMAMHLQSQIIAINNENITGFDKIGYQRQDPVVSSFTEFIGIHGLSKATDDQVGRIVASDNPLDCAISVKGYFQTMDKDGIKITRDGRFKLDKDGNLLTLTDASVLSNSGMPIQLPFVPERIEDIKINAKGDIRVFNHKTMKQEYAGTIGVVDTEGRLVTRPEIKQAYNEASNVSLQNEFISMMPVVRNFEANRQMFLIQNQNLSKVISQLGQGS